jgi:hypothetical protein
MIGKGEGLMEISKNYRDPIEIYKLVLNSDSRSLEALNQYIQVLVHGEGLICTVRQV